MRRNARSTPRRIASCRAEAGDGRRNEYVRSVQSRCGLHEATEKETQETSSRVEKTKQTMTMFKTRQSPGGNGGAIELECRSCGKPTVVVVAEIDGPPRCEECSSLGSAKRPGGTVTIGCRRCGQEIEIGVIELSRLHHTPLCENCEADLTGPGARPLCSLKGIK